MSLIHGGDVEGYRLEYGAVPLDFSANINPLGLPPSVQKSLAKAISQAEHYPDPLCRALSSAIAEREGLPAAYVLCGAGAADLIFRLALALQPRRALLIAPTFAEYEQALNIVDCAIEYHPLLAEEGFSLTESILPRLCSGIDILFLCNPNNPTGLTIDPALLQKILRRCAEEGIWLVVDECFNGLLDEPPPYTLRGFLADYINLLILDAFTKLYAMPGLRLGYALSANTALLEKLRRMGQPWPVSGPAQAAGLAALASPAYLMHTHAVLRRERAYLLKGLQSVGFTVLGGEANFIFFYSPVQRLAERLRQLGVLIRDCANFRGLGTGYYRIAVRSRGDNERLLAQIRLLTEAKDE